MCCDNAWGFFDIYSVHSVHLLERMDWFHIFLRDQPPDFFFHTFALQVSSPPSICFPLIAPGCRSVPPLRDDRPRYLVESQICQERRISPGHETVTILSKEKPHLLCWGLDIGDFTSQHTFYLTTWVAKLDFQITMWLVLLHEVQTSSNI